MSAIYSQSVSGLYRKIKDYSSYGLLLIYFGCSWIRWPRENGLPDQAIMLDLSNRKAYLFGIQIWPEEVYYIAALLILAALGLFFVTSLFGRIWCGYTCPHTVFIDLFIKVERFFQGDRNTRMKLDSQPLDFSKLVKKILTHVAWAWIAFGFAFGWVCYFYDAPLLIRDIASFQVTSGGKTWLIGLTVSTYIFAGFVREKVCIYMCPYGRFQSAMLDSNSSVVTYHDWRGEPRGKYDPDNKALGDCIDCGKCVVVCPMGIDIRNGLQLACIGCGLCVDACNSVMQKLGQPLELIAYDSISSTNAKMKGERSSKRVTYLKGHC
jgi:cytochrome c oxidase accessory protein FixG